MSVVVGHFLPPFSSDISVSLSLLSNSSEGRLRRKAHRAGKHTQRSASLSHTHTHTSTSTSTLQGGNTLDEGLSLSPLLLLPSRVGYSQHHHSNSITHTEREEDTLFVHAGVFRYQHWTLAMSGSARMHGGSSRRATSASPSKRRCVPVACGFSRFFFACSSSAVVVVYWRLGVCVCVCVRLCVGVPLSLSLCMYTCV